MTKNANTILMLRYSINRYQRMGNGAMCQVLKSKLQKLLAQQAELA
ncbi:MAG: hypothetical protein K5856_05260 [Bacteroidaceae bacterium]|nr:hypothetical protein [Bacteroidaceae bacterium]